MLSGSVAVTPSGHGSSRIQSPCLKTTDYDFAVAALVTAAVAASLILIAMFFVWYASLAGPPWRADHPPGSRTVFASPSEERTADTHDSLLNEVNRPDELASDPSVKFDEPAITQLDSFVEFEPHAANSAASIKDLSEPQDGIGTFPGAAEGGTGRPLGIGAERGNGASQRWVFEFTATASADEYAASLQFFGIELAADLDSEDRVAWLSNPAAAKPAVTYTGKTAVTADNRFYTMWAEDSGESVAADRELFARGGVVLSSARILHFYPSHIERLLESLEQDYAGRQPSEIRRTCFCIRKTQEGFEFFVREQLIR